MSIGVLFVVCFWAEKQAGQLKRPEWEALFN